MVEHNGELKIDEAQADIPYIIFQLGYLQEGQIEKINFDTTSEKPILNHWKNTTLQAQ